MNDQDDVKVNSDAHSEQKGASETSVSEPSDQNLNHIQEDITISDDTVVVASDQPPDSDSQPNNTAQVESAQVHDGTDQTTEEEQTGESTPVAEATSTSASDNQTVPTEDQDEAGVTTSAEDAQTLIDDAPDDDPRAKWYVVHTYSGHENKVAAALKQRVESEHLDDQILDILVPTQEKIEIRGGKKSSVKEKIFPGYILVKMILDDNSWLAVRTTQGVTSFVGIGNKPTPIPEAEVKTIVRFMTQGAAPTFKDVYMVDDTVKITDGPFAEFIGKVDSVDKEHGKVRVLVSIFGRETPVELDFLQVQKL